MVRSVPLNQLPAGLQFPAYLTEKVSYDAEAKQLRFRGFMAKADFDELSRLSNDLSYLRALENLFQICVFEDNVPASSISWVTIGVGVSIMLCVVGGMAAWFLTRHA